jgi:hypothetical protein
VLSQQPISYDENVVFNYQCGSKIKNITEGAESITNGYDLSLITFETFRDILLHPGSNFFKKFFLLCIIFIGKANKLTLSFFVFRCFVIVSHL